MLIQEQFKEAARQLESCYNFRAAVPSKSVRKASHATNVQQAFNKKSRWCLHFLLWVFDEKATYKVNGAR